MLDANPTVLIVDDDPEFRDSVARLLRTVGLQTQQFSSVADFFKAVPPDGPTCLVLDVRLPGGTSGLEYLEKFADLGIRLPVVMTTGYGDVEMTVRAMKAGAADFLTKPFRAREMIDAVTTALERDRQRRTVEAEQTLLRERFALLCKRQGDRTWRG